MMKEYLTRKEAAEYMCVSLRGFQNLVKEWDIPSGKVPGAKIIFRRSDLQKLNERFFNAESMLID